MLRQVFAGLHSLFAINTEMLHNKRVNLNSIQLSCRIERFSYGQRWKEWVIPGGLCHTHRHKGRDTRRDKSLWHVAATGCCNKSPRVTCENHCRCDRISSLQSVAQIQTGLNSCDISQRQTKRKRLVAAAVQTRGLVAAICRIACLCLNWMAWCDARLT